MTLIQYDVIMQQLIKNWSVLPIFCYKIGLTLSFQCVFRAQTSAHAGHVLAFVSRFSVGNYHENNSSCPDSS